MDEAEKEFKDKDDDVNAAARRCVLMEGEATVSVEKLATTVMKLALMSKEADNIIKGARHWESKNMNNEMEIETLETNLKEAKRIASDNEMKSDNLARSLAMMEDELKRAEERVKIAEERVVKIEELSAIGENQKQLEISEEKARRREEKYQDQIKQLNIRLGGGSAEFRMAGRLPACVIDVGTGYTKMGYAGNKEPQFIMPSAIAVKETAKAGDERRATRGMEDLDFHIGDEAMNVGNPYAVKYPVRHGLVEDWDLMEKFLEHCIFRYLRAEPEDHYFLLTEPPLNTPENREYTAEIMFESFNVPGLYIAVQAVLSLAASWTRRQVGERTLTGVVIDSGDGVTHVIPVAEGYVIGSCIKHIPIAGRSITSFIQHLLREREIGIPPEQSLETAKAIKERYCYMCPNIAKEFNRFDQPG